MNTLRHLDDQLMVSINTFAKHTPALHAAFLAYAKYGIVLFAALLVAALVAARNRSSRDLAATGWAALAPLAALALNQPLGHVFTEQRPYVTHPQLLRLADATTDFSFPSDHAVMAGAVAAALLLAHRRLGLLALLAALLMAFARVYIAAHYPWDVVGGLAFGAVVAILGWALVRRVLVPLTRWLRTRPGLRSVFAEQGAAHARAGSTPTVPAT